MWPKATNVLEEFYYHWRMKRGVGDKCGKGGNVSPTFLIGGGGGQWYVCVPHFFD